MNITAKDFERLAELRVPASSLVLQDVAGAVEAEDLKGATGAGWVLEPLREAVELHHDDHAERVLQGRQDALCREVANRRRDLDRLGGAGVVVGDEGLVDVGAEDDFLA